MKKNIKKILVGIVTICVIGVTGSIVYLNNTKEDNTVTTSNATNKQKVKTEKIDTKEDKKEIEQQEPVEESKVNTDVFNTIKQSLGDDIFYSESVLRAYGWYRTEDYYTATRYDFNDNTCLSIPATIVESTDKYVIYKYNDSDVIVIVYISQVNGRYLLNFTSSATMKLDALLPGPTEQQLEQERADGAVFEANNHSFYEENNTTDDTSTSNESSSNHMSKKEQQLAILRDEYANALYGKTFHECNSGAQLNIDHKIYQDWEWNVPGQYFQER